MHFSALVIPVIIVLWAVFEYRLRERNHRERMAILASGLTPPESSSDRPSWMLWTTGTIAILLFLLIAGLILLGITTIAPYDTPFYFIALPFVPILVVLLLIFRRDYHASKDLSRANRKTS